MTALVLVVAILVWQFIFDLGVLWALSRLAGGER